MSRYDVPSGVLTVLTDPSNPNTLMALSWISTRYLMAPSRSTMVVNGRPAPADPLNNLAMCWADGRFFRPSTGLAMQLTICSHWDAKRNAAGCWLTPLMRFGMELLMRGMVSDAGPRLA